MRFVADRFGRRFLHGLMAVCFGCLGAENTALAQGESAAGGKQLSISLPEVVVETPSIEHLIAARVRPAPPKRLGVRLPAVFVELDVPSIRPPARPIPHEKNPELDLTLFFGSAPDEFVDESEHFNTAYAYLQKGSPVEALALFDALAKKTEIHFWRAAALFWAGETLEGLRKAGEARERRERLVNVLLTDGLRYVAAARYALAQERCEARDYEGCLSLLEGQAWDKEEFAYEEAIFLQGWAQAKAGSAEEAIDTWTMLANAKGRLAFRALVALGHLYLQRKNYAQAEKRYAAAEALGSARGKPDEGFQGEALYGIGWTRLFLGRAEEAKRAFSLFMRRHPKHLLGGSVQAGLLSAEIELIQKSRKGLNSLKQRLQGFSRLNRRKTLAGALRLQLTWKLFRIGMYEEASVLAGRVSDEFPLGRVYRIARIVEGLSQYHLGQVKRAYGILRLGADYPPASVQQLAEQDAARSAAMGAAFAAFRLRDFKGALNVLKHWAFLPGSGGPALTPDGLAMLWYGEAAFELGDLDEAARAFRAIPKNAPEFYSALGGLAWIRYRKMNWSEAARAFDRVFEHRPGGVLAAEALARAGEARFNLRNYDGALQSFERIEKKYRGSDVAKEALYQKAKLLFRRSRFEAAEKNFHVFLKRYPKSKSVAEVRYLLALIPFRKGDYALARKKLLDFLESFRGSTLAGDVYLRLADSSYNEGSYKDANRLYRLMMNRYSSHPKFPEAAYGRLLTHLQLGEYENFLADARGYIERYPERNLSISLAFQIGEVLLTQRNTAEALRAYKDVIARYPGNELAAHAMLRVAGIHRSKKDIDKALDSYETLLTQHPAGGFRADVLFGVGETLAGIGRCAEAKQKLAEFLETYPAHDYAMLARFALGRCLVRLAEDGAALTHLAAIMKSGFAGEDLRSQSALLAAELYRKRRKYADAERALGVAVELGAPDLAVEAFFAYARISSERRDPGAAAEYLKLTYRYPDQKIWVARALGRAGELYEKAGKRKLALRIYRKMSKVVKDPALKRKARIAIRRITKQTKKRARR
ncbi:MAG: tetratricopeptide repeat protein [Nitrospinae bacterium]|nr:tetratricopeptide repeat protein [Nitrospinota bacterium]